MKRGEPDIERAVQNALARSHHKGKLKFGKEYYGATEEVPRGKGGMDMRDF